MAPHDLSHTPGHRLSFDAVILGGGIAGLWMLNRLLAAGYNAILLEQEALGSGQSIASQGMIHGGVKYTLAGQLSGASEAIADMPDYWRSCLAGTGPVNLTRTRPLSDHFYMWSTESTLSKITGFLASKTLRGRVTALTPEQHPPVFRQKDFKGTVYELVDSVIDTASLLANLADNAKGRVFRAEPARLRWSREAGTLSLYIKDAQTEHRIEAGQFIFAAGQGNEALLQQIDAASPRMQVRPLQQVLVKHRQDYRLYAHCVGRDSTPRLTISTHPCADGSLCWYLGGQLAEQGVKKTADALIREAKTELMNLFPWLDWQAAQWATLHVVRAEPRQKQLVRPDNAFLEPAMMSTPEVPFHNVLVAWPTKLTLAPHLGDACLSAMQRASIAPASHGSDPAQLALPAPPVAAAPWDTAVWRS